MAFAAVFTPTLVQTLLGWLLVNEQIAALW
jgi:hypothetical protein